MLLNGEWQTRYSFILNRKTLRNCKSLDSIICNNSSLLREVRESRPQFTLATTTKFDIIEGDGISYSNFFEDGYGKIVLSKKPVDVEHFKWNIHRSETADSLLFHFLEAESYRKSRIIYIDKNILVLSGDEVLITILFRVKKINKYISCQYLADIIRGPLKSIYSK